MKYREYSEFLELIRKSEVQSIQFEIFDTTDSVHFATVYLKNKEKFGVNVLSTSITLLSAYCFEHKTHLSFDSKMSVRTLWRRFWVPVVIGLLGVFTSYLGIVLFMPWVAAPPAPPATESITPPSFATVVLKDKNTSGSKEKITLGDVVIDESLERELLEIGEYLHHPERFEKMGVVPPKGLLLTGDPGTGKTFVAKALADALSANFIAVKGADFQSKWVGQGSKFIRDTFEYARKKSPCLIYIDEVDELAKDRDNRNEYVGGSASQSLNQLLVELDGFHGRDQIFVIAATNLPNMIDPALLRPGRLERRLFFPLPNEKQRARILNKHIARRKITLENTNISEIVAKKTNGWSGAKLNTLINEAAIEAAGNGRICIEEKDFHEAYVRMKLGSRQKSSWTAENIKKVAVHEAGHLLCKWVHDQSIATTVGQREHQYYATVLPTTSGALGLITMDRTDDLMYFPEKKSLRLQMVCGLAGREAERLFYSDKNIDGGAFSDFLQAKSLLLNYIGLGFSDNKNFYGHCIDFCYNDDGIKNFSKYSSSLQKELLDEVDILWEDLRQDCETLLRNNFETLRDLSELLFAKETLLHEDILEFFKTHSVIF